MKTIQIILLALTSISGCAQNTGSTSAAPNNISIMNSTDTISYLALGDSYTIGEAVPQVESYPYQLADALNKQSFHVQPPTIIAVSGWTTDDLISAISQSSITDKKFSFVALLIGVNDQYQQLSQDNYKIKFAQVLNTAITFANGNASRVFVVSIPDWGVTPFAAGQGSIIAPQIDQFNTINKSISKAAGVDYLDITPISRQAATDTSLIASDGLHPSGKMYTLWVNSLEPMIAVQLKK
jgi:lysophospholipase L1-like esterase